MPDTCKSDKVISVRQNRQYIDDQIGRLEGNAVELEKRLGELTRNEPNGIECEKKGTEEPCKFAQELCVFGNRLRDLNVRLEGLLSRLEF